MGGGRKQLHTDVQAEGYGKKTDEHSGTLLPKDVLPVSVNHCCSRQPSVNELPLPAALAGGVGGYMTLFSSEKANETLCFPPGPSNPATGLPCSLPYSS